MNQEIPDLSEVSTDDSAQVEQAKRELEDATAESVEAVRRLEARVRQETLGSAKGPRPTPPVRSPRKKARIAAREARRLNRKR